MTCSLKICAEILHIAYFPLVRSLNLGFNQKNIPIPNCVDIFRSFCDLFPWKYTTFRYEKMTWIFELNLKGWI